MQPAQQDAFSVSRKRAVFRLSRYSRPRNDEITAKAGTGPLPLPVILEPELCTMYFMKTITMIDDSGLLPDPLRAESARSLAFRFPHGGQISNLKFEIKF
jgi:hypothetical protein